MADVNRFKSISVNLEDWKELGVLAEKTSRTRSRMLSKLIKFYKEYRGEKKNGK